MALSLTQVVIGTSSASLVSVPPGPCTVVITAGTQAAPATLYVSTAATATTAGGMPVTTSAPLTLQVPGGSSGAALTAIASAASTPVGIAIAAPDRGA